MLGPDGTLSLPAWVQLVFTSDLSTSLAMGHPDQRTPDNHRSSTDQDAPTPDVSQDLADDLKDDSLQEAADTGTDVRAPEPGEEHRQGEAGNAYVGRQMSDAQKANPRVEDADRVQKDDDR